EIDSVPGPVCAGIRTSGLAVAILLAGLRGVVLLRSEVTIARAGIARVLLVLAEILIPFSYALSGARVSLNIVRQSRGTGAEDKGCRKSYLGFAEHCRISWLD